MSTFKAYLKKEVLESSRQYRYLVLAIGIIFFAITSPVMLKLLPEILKNQSTSGMIITLPDMVPKDSLNEFVKNLFQIVTIIVVFTICGTISDELTTQKLIFPYAKGSSPSGIVLAKLFHYGLTVTLITLIAFSVNCYYSNLLFKGDPLPFGDVMISALYASLYFFFNIVLTIFLSSIIKKGIVAGITVLGINYFSLLFSKVKVVENLLPYKLLDSANIPVNTDISKSIVAVIIYCIALAAFTIYRMSKVEVV